MQIGDKVYFQYQDKHGVKKKYPAIILEKNSDDSEKFLIRLGRLNVMSQTTELFEHEARTDLLTVRRTACSFEHELISGVAD